MGGRARGATVPRRIGHLGDLRATGYPDEDIRNEAIDFAKCADDSPEGFLTFLQWCRTPHNGGLQPLPVPRPWDDPNADWAFVARIARSMHRAETQGLDFASVKSRQMMMSWLIAAYMLWRVSFRANWQGFVTSRKERLVDDGGEHSTTNSFMGRMRFMYDNLPAFLRVGIVFTHLKATCVAWNSYVVGEGASTDIARGGTYAIGVRDESAYIPSSEAVHASMRAACRSIFDVSTPNGPEGYFARIWEQRPSGVIFERIGWWEHPERRYELRYIDGKPTSPWYETERATMTPDQVAREQDMSFAHSVSGQVFPEFSIERHVRYGLKYDPSLTLNVGIDFGIGAPTAAVFFQIAPTPSGGEVRVIGEHEEPGLVAIENASRIWHMCVALGFRGTPAEVLCHGDPAGNARDQVTKSTVINEYRVFGFTQFRTKTTGVKDGIRLVRRLMHQGRLFVSNELSRFPLRVAAYRYPTDDAGGVKSEDPVKNIATHMMDALRYGMVGTFPLDAFTANGWQAPLPPRHADATPLGREAGWGSVQPEHVVYVPRREW